MHADSIRTGQNGAGLPVLHRGVGEEEGIVRGKSFVEMRSLSDERIDNQGASFDNTILYYEILSHHACSDACHRGASGRRVGDYGTVHKATSPFYSDSGPYANIKEFAAISDMNSGAVL